MQVKLAYYASSFKDTHISNIFYVFLKKKICKSKRWCHLAIVSKISQQSNPNTFPHIVWQAGQGLEAMDEAFPGFRPLTAPLPASWTRHQPHLLKMPKSALALAPAKLLCIVPQYCGSLSTDKIITHRGRHSRPWVWIWKIGYALSILRYVL